MKDEMDILREISSIAAAHGSKALSEMVERRIELTLPTVEALSPTKMAEKLACNDVVMCVQSRILSGLCGSIILILEEKNAYKLLDICCKKSDRERGGLFTEMGLSAIKEIGNVIIGAYSGALSIIMKAPIIPSIPTLINGPVREILSSVAIPYGEEDFVVLIEAAFQASNEEVKGGLYFILTPDTMKRIQQACKNILDRLE